MTKPATTPTNTAPVGAQGIAPEVSTTVLGDGWRETVLSEFIAIQKNQFKPSKDQDFAYIGLEHIEQEKLRLNSVGSSLDISSNKFKFEANDVLFGKLRPYFRKVIKPKFSGVCSTDIWVMRATKGFSQDFLFYFAANWDFVDTANAGEGGSRMPRADWNFLKNSTWLIPPLPEQKAISAVLSSLDDKIDLLHRQNQTLEAMAQTLFRQWFIEAAGEGWEDGFLSDVALNIKESIQPVQMDGEMPYIGLEHISRKSIALNQFGKASDISSNKYRFTKQDILFGKLRPYFHKVCFAPFNGVCSTDILVIRPKKESWFTFCLFVFFQDDVVEYANLGSGGTRMPRTDWGTLGQYEIKIPDESMIEKFNQVSLPILHKIKQNLEKIQSLTQLRDTLLPKLMSGEVRVKIATEAINGFN